MATSTCVHCSPDRTVWLHADDDAAPTTIEKVYVTGSLADAEREFRMGAAAAGPGVVEYLSVQAESAQHRPAVRLRFVAGDNLEQLVAAEGALPAARALALLRPVAETLARLHGLCTQALPHGMCHGDVKPQNLLHDPRQDDGSTILLDFEHARPIATGDGDGVTFTGGTSAFAPPEARRGAAPDAAFDVFGLGATLAYLLDGGTEHRLPQHPDVEALVRACCAHEARERPTAAAFVARCDELTVQLRDDPHEAALHAAACGEDATTTATARTPHADEVAKWVRHRERLRRRLPDLLAADAPTDLPDSPNALLHAVEANRRLLARFPRHHAMLQRRQHLVEHTAALLRAAAGHVREACREERFAAVHAWLHTLDVLIELVATTPVGHATLARPEPGAAPGAQQRAPRAFLIQLLEGVEQRRDDLRARTMQVAAAQRAFDLDLAEQLIDALAADYGGTAPSVAAQRDELHRLTFYLDRIARARPNVDRVGPLWDASGLAPLTELVHAADDATARRTGKGGTGAVGLRSLLLTLTSVRDEFAHLETVPAALAALGEALERLTDQAWQQLADAEQRLGIVPVPVRPLQLALGRLDTFRVLEAFVDRPERPRGQLVDGIERLRLALDQARSARDRLAENAEHALARGHWTTGLFEMERAVAGLQPNDDDQQEAARLRARLQAARRTKQEIESAVRRNVELDARYARLEDDASSTFEARLRALIERRDCLLFLGMHVQSDRAELYRRDLRSVETSIAVERAAEAERRLDGLTDPQARLQLASETIDLLGTTGQQSTGADNEPPGRVVRLLTTWRQIAERCQQAVDRERALAHRREVRRRLWWAAAILLVIGGGTIALLMFDHWPFGNDVRAGSR